MLLCAPRRRIGPFPTTYRKVRTLSVFSRRFQQIEIRRSSARFCSWKNGPTCSCGKTSLRPRCSLRRTSAACNGLWCSDCATCTAAGETNQNLFDQWKILSLDSYLNFHQTPANKSCLMSEQPTRWNGRPGSDSTAGVWLRRLNHTGCQAIHLPTRQSWVRIGSIAGGLETCPEEVSMAEVTNSRLPPPTETNRVVNTRPPVKPRVQEFRAEILGCGSNPHGCFRTPVGLSRKRDFSASRRNRENPCGKGKKRETPRA